MTETPPTSQKQKVKRTNRSHDCVTCASKEKCNIIVSVQCLPIKELHYNFVIGKRHYQTIINDLHSNDPHFLLEILHIFVSLFKSVHIPLLRSLPPADTHVDDLVAPHASCKRSWQTTDGCLWSDNNEQPASNYERDRQETRRQQARR